jgi:hypothetical protein
MNFNCDNLYLIAREHYQSLLYEAERYRQQQVVTDGAPRQIGFIWRAAAAAKNLAAGLRLHRPVSQRMIR